MVTHFKWGQTCKMFLRVKRHLETQCMKELKNSFKPNKKWMCLEAQHSLSCLNTRQTKAESHHLRLLNTFTTFIRPLRKKGAYKVFQNLALLLSLKDTKLDCRLMGKDYKSKRLNNRLRLEATRLLKQSVKQKNTRKLHLHIG